MSKIQEEVKQNFIKDNILEYSSEDNKFELNFKNQDISWKKIKDIYIGEIYKNKTDVRLSNEEIEIYINQLNKNKIKNEKVNRKIKWIVFVVNGEDIDVSYGLETLPFERIRRITGYLVGTMNHWNNAKRAEEKDRVKHNRSCC